MELPVGRKRGFPTISLSASRSSYACGLSRGEDPTMSPPRWYLLDYVPRARKGRPLGQSIRKILMSSAVASWVRYSSEFALVMATLDWSLNSGSKDAAIKRRRITLWLRSAMPRLRLQKCRDERDHPEAEQATDTCIFLGRSDSFWIGGHGIISQTKVAAPMGAAGRAAERLMSRTVIWLVAAGAGRSGRGARRGVAWQTERAGRTEPRCQAGRFDRDGREGCLASIAAVVRCAATWSAAADDTAGRADADVRRGAHRARRAGRHRRARPARRQGRAARRRKGDCPDPCRSKWRVGGDGAGTAAQRGPARTARAATRRGPCAGHLGPGRGGGGAEAARRRRSTRGVRRWS